MWCCFAAIITAIEFAAGCIVNLWLQMDVWDYSFLPLNLFGQVCLLYTFLWALLCIPVAYLVQAMGKRFH